MQDISLHLLDIIENSAHAQAKNINITIDIDKILNQLLIEVNDDGKGMDDQTLINAQQPFFTTKSQKKKKDWSGNTII
jgi:signal transduction histidine kinase